MALCLKCFGGIFKTTLQFLENNLKGNDVQQLFHFIEVVTKNSKNTKAKNFVSRVT